MRLLLVFFAVKYLFTEAFTVPFPIVEIEDGKVQGKLSKTDAGKSFYEFREIPYAAPPIGDLRLAEPVPPLKWKGIRDGTKLTKICVAHYVGITSSDISWALQNEKENEDCLYSNVFTTKLPSKENTTEILLPVYVYIYGGIFSFGNSEFWDFQYFINEDVVVVSFNYRSSSLGFLTTGDDVIPANIGLKDQLMLLKWVKKNIAHFGGDPEKITIGGHSSGAAAVGYHLLNPRSKGLFRAAIIQSGTPLQPVSFLAKTRDLAFKLGEILSPDFVAAKNTSEDLLKLLRTFPAETVARTEFNISDERFTYPILGYRPLWVPTEEDPNHANALVVGPMHENLKKGFSNHIPILIGVADEERKFFDITNRAALADANLTLVWDPTVDVKKENIGCTVKEIKNIYSSSSKFSDNLSGTIKLTGDLVFSIPVKMHAFLESKFSDVYFYQFSYMGPINRLDEWKASKNFKLKEISPDDGLTPKTFENWLRIIKNLEYYSIFYLLITCISQYTQPPFSVIRLGTSAHGDELQLLFNHKVKKEIPPSDLDLLMRKRIVKLWANFIKYSNPTPEEDPLFQNKIWPKVSQENYKYLEIASNFSIKENPPRFKEWMEKIDKYLESPRYLY